MPRLLTPDLQGDQPRGLRLTGPCTVVLRWAAVICLAVALVGVISANPACGQVSDSAHADADVEVLRSGQTERHVPIGGSDTAAVRQAFRRGVRPQRWYRLAARYRIEPMGAAPSVRVYWYNRHDQIMGVKDVAGGQSVTDDANGAQSGSGANGRHSGSTDEGGVDRRWSEWNDLTYELKSPKGAASITVELRAGGGTVAWAEARLEELPLVEDLGPQVFDLHHRAVVFNGHEMYVLSESRPYLGIIDLRDGTRTHLYELDHGGALEGIIHSSGDVYFGVGGLMRFDPHTHEITYLELPVGRIRDLKEAPDGALWGSTNPDGDIFRYQPVTGAFESYGPVREGYRYANGVAMCGAKMFASIGSPAQLFVYDPGQHPGRNLIPQRYREESHARNLVCYGDRLFSLIRTTGEGLVIDTQTLEEVHAMPSVGSHGYSEPDHRNRVFYTAGGRLHYYDLDDDATSPVELDQHVGNAAEFAWVRLGLPNFPGRSLVGVERYGFWWMWNPQTGAFRRTATDMPHQPYRTHSIHFGPDGKLYGVGYIGSGSFMLDPRRPADSVQLDGPGQAEGITSVGDTLYFGVYSGARFYKQPVHEPWDPEFLFRLSDMGQNRPFEAVSANGKYYIGSIPMRGLLGGVFAEYNPRTNRHRAWRHLSTDQAVTAIAVRGVRAYIGTSISGGLSSRPTTRSGRLVVFNLETEEVEHTLVPVEGEPAIGALTFGPDSLLWGLTKGKLFRYDPSIGEVVDSRELFEDVGWNSPDHNWGYAERLVTSRDGCVYGTNTAYFFRIDPATIEHEVVSTERPVRVTEGPDGRLWFIGGPRKHLFRYNK